MLACRLLGHRYRFRADGRKLSWTCHRCGHRGGTRTYQEEQRAVRYARAFDREDTDALGRRAPLGLLPLRLLARLRRTRERTRRRRP